MTRIDRQAFQIVFGVAVIIVVLGALLVMCVAILPGWIVGPDSGDGLANAITRLDRLKAENDIRLTLLQGLGGLLALSGVGLGFVATLRQVRANREGNNIALFTKAIDQLSSENVSVRHGGIYALELLAGLDSDYRGYIHALLTAFVRRQAPWPNGLALAWVEAVELDSSCDVGHAGLVFAGGEVAGFLGGPGAGPVGAVADEEPRVQDLEQEGGQGQVKLVRGGNPP